VVALADLHQEVRAAIEAGEIERPRKICRAILAARPDNLETILLDAELSLEAGANRLAIGKLERVLASDPEAYLACAGLAIAYEGMRDPAAALHWYSRALDLEPMNREIQRERDRLLQLAYPGSIPPDKPSDFALARSFVAAGFGSKALQSHYAALDDEPGRLEIKLGLAELLWLLNRTTEAEDMCQRILATAPRAVKAHALLACLAAEAGDVMRGRALLADIHTQDPDGRIAAYLINQTALAPWATEAVDLKISVGTPMPAYAPIDAPAWTRWMRAALWQVLRLVLPPGAEDAEEDSARELPAVIEPQPVLSSGPLGRRLQTGNGAHSADPSDDASTLERALVSEEILRFEFDPHFAPPPAHSSAKALKPLPTPADEDTTEIIEP
jgi:tetratricopeptide (TPR) repeat protein